MELIGDGVSALTNREVGAGAETMDGVCSESNFLHVKEMCRV